MPSTARLSDWFAMKRGTGGDPSVTGACAGDTSPFKGGKRHARRGRFEIGIASTKKQSPTRGDCFLVPVTGLEPVRDRSQGILSPWCLPFHHTGAANTMYHAPEEVSRKKAMGESEARKAAFLKKRMKGGQGPFR